MQNCQINTFTIKEWELCKRFRAFNTVHGKLPPIRLPPTLTLVQTLAQIQGGFVGGGEAIFRWAISLEAIFRHDLDITFSNKN